VPALANIFEASFKGHYLINLKSNRAKVGAATLAKVQKNFDGYLSSNKIKIIDPVQNN
jgi:hypothetical protein